MILSPEATDCQNKRNHPALGVIFSLELLVRSFLDTSQTIQTIALVLGCPPEMHRKTPLLKTSHTLFVGHGEIQSVLTGKRPPS